MFEEFHPDDLATRLRRRLFFIVAAYLLAQQYVVFHPSRWLFDFDRLMLLAAAAQALLVIWLAVRERRQLRGRAIAYLVVCLIASLVALSDFLLVLPVPWH